MSIADTSHNGSAGVVENPARLPLSTDAKFMALARRQAETSLAAGGIPVGSVLVRGMQVLGQGHNERVQLGDPIAHGEMDCIRSAGRQRSYRDTVLYTTLSPCMMCSGAIVLFHIPRVVVGENRSFGGNEEFLRSRGVIVDVLDDPKCKALMDEFVKRYPQVWSEDIGELTLACGSSGMPS